ncbi:signal peptidase II [Erythrobacter colymbi]|uniref:signal peptidase II n=1 Tax=Erythrobacter colymbi TaxID=1161202 RepID=UPI000A3D4D3E|nr:signal peptidase II [Erythrobacter colymbi]
MSELFTRNRLIGLALAALVALIDQAVKWYVIGPLQLRQVLKIDLLPFFDLTYTENRGVSLGMFEASSMETRWALVAVTAGIALMVLLWMMREKKLADIAGLALILGGALGNIRDRYDLGYVIDFADFHIGTFRPFLIFNVADAAITIGVVIILARSLLVRDKDTTSTGETPRGEAQDA